MVCLKVEVDLCENPYSHIRAYQSYSQPQLALYFLVVSLARYTLLSLGIMVL
jgi:hypothetical protein